MYQGISNGVKSAKISSAVKKIAAVLVTAYFLSALMMLLFQKKYIYCPSGKIIETPSEKGMKYEDVFFNSADGEKLNGWYFPADDSSFVVLFCHGNADNISYFIDSVKQLRELGINVFIFDYRGYGRSTGRQSETGTYFDAVAAWNFLTQKKKIKRGNIIVLGRSLGGPIAAYLAKEYRPRALFLESTFTSIPDIAVQMYPYLPIKKFLRYKYNTIEYLKKVKCPVLVVHSSDDRKVPFSNGRKLFEEAPGFKKFIELKGSHRDCFTVSLQTYQEGIREFLKELKHRH